MHTYFSTHRIADGKWEITIWIYEHEELKHSSIERPELRGLIDQHYDLDPLSMAKVIMENMLHCEKVQVNTLSGSGVYVER